MKLRYLDALDGLMGTKHLVSRLLVFAWGLGLWYPVRVTRSFAMTLDETNSLVIGNSIAIRTRIAVIVAATC